MLEIFDGFIAAINTETKIPFHKEADGKYSANITFEGGRKQKVIVSLGKDESGDSVLNYCSNIKKLEEKDSALFKEVLTLNASLTYGAIAIMKDTFVIHQTYFVKDLDPQRFMKSLLYVAAKADELEDIFKK